MGDVRIKCICPHCLSDNAEKSMKDDTIYCFSCRKIFKIIETEEEFIE